MKKLKLFSDVLDQDELLEDVNSYSPSDTDETFQSNEDLTTEDLTKALKVIEAVSEAVLQEQGEDTSDVDYAGALDIIDEVLDVDLPEEDEALPEEVLNSVINLHVVTPEDGEERLEEVSFSPATDESYDTVTCSDPEECFDEVETDEESEIDLVVNSSANPATAKIVSKKVRLNSHWKDKDEMHKRAWAAAEERVKSQGKDPSQGASYYATVMAVAKAYLNKYLDEDINSWEEAVDLMASVKRVVAAIRRKLTSSKSLSKQEKIRQSLVEGGKPETPVTEPVKEPATADNIEEVGLGADGGVLTGDVEGGSTQTQEANPLPKIDFNGPTEEIELPTENGSKEKLEFTEVANSVYCLNNSISDKRIAYYAGKVKPLSNGLGIVFVRSNVFGLVGIKGKFVKGIRNSVYAAFAKVSSSLHVNSEGYSVAGNYNGFIISSVSSNRSLQKTETSYDVVQKLESAYMWKLCQTRGKELVRTKRLEQSVAYLKTVSDKRAKLLKSSLRENRKLANSVNSTINEYKQKLAQDEFNRELQERDAMLASNAELSAANKNKNIEFLSRLF